MNGKYLASLGVLLVLGGCVARGEVLVPNDFDSGVNAGRAFAVSASDRHSCAVVNGRALCWGSNEYGQLGSGGVESQLRPTPIAIGPRVIQISAGAEHSCSIDDVGRVYCWGANDRGQLGVGDRNARLVPATVALPAPATLVATKFRHTCALLLDARLFCWGDNTEGELGQADAFPSDDETAADGLTPLAVGDGGWRAVDTGDGHTCAVRMDGQLWCWGRNSEHELGAETRVQVREPVAVAEEKDWLNVAAGQNHTCALKQDRTIWCWGANSGRQSDEGCPLGLDGNEIENPTRVGDAGDWAQIATNTFHTCALSRNDELYCWGRDVEGQLGLGDYALRTEPTLVSSGVSSVSVGRFSSCALWSAGSISCAGDNSSGQLGTGDTDRRDLLTPAQTVN